MAYTWLSHGLNGVFVYKTHTENEVILGLRRLHKSGTKDPHFTGMTAVTLLHSMAKWNVFI